MVDISEGVIEIGEKAFACTMNLDEIRIASTVKRIGRLAFNNAKARSIILPEGLETIGDGGFCGSFLLSRFRIPSLITALSEGMLYGCQFTFSLELPEGIRRLEFESLGSCCSLRNVALSSPRLCRFVDSDAFVECTDLLSIFGTSYQVGNELQHRFDNLPIHKMIYYQSYNNLTVEQLTDATNMRSGTRTLRSKLDLSGNMQDTLGMTPLHILACSTVQNVDMYRIIIDKYPDNLITKDKWGALPLLYAIWGQVPDEIIELLVDKYKLLYPNFAFDSGNMFETLARTDAPWGPTVQWDLLIRFSEVQKKLWPEQNTTAWWNRLLYKVADDKTFRDDPGISPGALLFMASNTLAIAPRFLDLGVLRHLVVEDIMKIYDKAVTGITRRTCLDELLSDIDQHKQDYCGMKYATTQLELALWNKKIEESVQVQKRPRKAKKYDASSFRKQCRVDCGASIIIPLVLPYLLPA